MNKTYFGIYVYIFVEGNAQLDIGLLIEMVQMYPFIFDLSSKEYKDGKKKEMAWKEISEVVGVSGTYRVVGA